MIDEESIQEELRIEERWERRKELWIGVKGAFTERCKNEHNWELSRPMRLFYVAKCLMCVFLCRKWKPKYGDYPDMVDVSTIYAHQLYAGWEACWLAVGHGILRNWFYKIETDGDWWM